MSWKIQSRKRKKLQKGKRGNESMKLSIIWKLSERENDNQVTLDYLKAELAKYEDAIQILIYPESKEQLYHASFQIKNGTVTTRSLIGASEVEVYEDAQKAVDGDFVTYLYNVFMYYSTPKHLVYKKKIKNEGE